MPPGLTTLPGEEVRMLRATNITSCQKEVKCSGLQKHFRTKKRWRLLQHFSMEKMGCSGLWAALPGKKRRNAPVTKAFPGEEYDQGYDSTSWWRGWDAPSYKRHFLTKRGKTLQAIKALPGEHVKAIIFLRPRFMCSFRYYYPLKIILGSTSSDGDNHFASEIIIKQE